MRTLVDKVRLFRDSEDGPTATEYAVMLGFIIVVAMVGIASFGTKVSGVFTAVHEPIGAAGGS